MSNQFQNNSIKKYIYSYICTISNLIFGLVNNLVLESVLYFYHSSISMDRLTSIYFEKKNYIVDIKIFLNCINLAING